MNNSKLTMSIFNILINPNKNNNNLINDITSIMSQTKTSLHIFNKN